MAALHRLCGILIDAEYADYSSSRVNSAAFGGTDQFDCKLDSCRDEYWKGVGDEAKQVSYVPPAGTAAEPSGSCVPIDDHAAPSRAQPDVCCVGPLFLTAETDGREPEDVPADDTDAAAGSSVAASTSQQVAP